MAPSATPKKRKTLEEVIKSVDSTNDEVMFRLLDDMDVATVYLCWVRHLAPRTQTRQNVHPRNY